MNFILYLLKVSFAAILLLGFYRFGLRRLTFFRLNRFYLIGSLILSFLLPLLSLEFYSLKENLPAGMHGIDWEQFEEIIVPRGTVIQSGTGFSLFLLIPYIYYIVLGVMLVLNTRKIVRLLADTGHQIVERSGRVTFLINRQGTGSYTVFRKVYLDAWIFKNRIDPVIRHEMVHANQLHSLDLIFMEFASALLWFNPFVFLFRRYARENHEFLADSQAHDGSVSLTDYLLCLKAESVRNLSPSIASYFKSSTLKKRIIMLTNNKSKSSRKWLYLLVLPLIATLLVSFSNSGKRVIPDVNRINSIIPAYTFVLEGDPVPSMFPLDKQYSSNVTWGHGEKRIHPFTKKEVIHNGMDIRAPKGSPIHATADGIVMKADLFEGWGKMVVINHGEQFQSRYAHMNEISVKPGDILKKGEVIGTVGTTGKSTGDHLHYEVRKDGESVDPKAYF